jgi:hypothetical protein
MEEFRCPTTDAEVSSKTLHFEKLLAIEKNLAGEDWCTIAIIGKLYELSAGALHSVPDRKGTDG